MFDLEVKETESIHSAIKELFEHGKHRASGPIKIYFASDKTWVNAIDAGAPVTLGRDWIR